MWMDPLVVSIKLQVMFTGPHDSVTTTESGLQAGMVGGLTPRSRFGGQVMTGGVGFLVKHTV